MPRICDNHLHLATGVKMQQSHDLDELPARAIPCAPSFQCIGMGLAPFCAGLIGPVLGLRAYFALFTALTLGGLMLWLRRVGM